MLIKQGILNKQGSLVGFINNKKRYILYQYWSKYRYKYPDILHTIICNNRQELDNLRRLSDVTKAKRDISSS